MRLSAKEASALKVILLAVLSITALGVAGWLMWALRSVLGLALAAAFAAFLFLPVAYWLNRRAHLPMGIACALVVLAIVALLAGLVAITIPALVRETRSLVSSLPDYLKTVQGYFSNVTEWLDHYQLGALKDAITAVLDSIQQSVISFGQNLLTASSKRLLGLSALVPFFVLMYFFMRGSHQYYGWFLSLPFVRQQREGAEQALAQVATGTRRYIEALALVASITSLLLGGLSGVFRINYALTIGVVDFFGEFIPYVGPLVVALLGAFFAAVAGPGKLVAWVVIFAAVEFVTSQILSPRLISEKTGLNPGFVILLLLAGGALAGFFGVLLAVPIAVFVREVIKSVHTLRSSAPSITETPVD